MPPKRGRYQENASIPAALTRKLAKAGETDASMDDGRFSKKFKNAAKARKEARKQARQEKKQRKNESHRRARGLTTPAKPNDSKSKPVRNTDVQKNKPSTAEKKPAKLTEEEERARLLRFAKRNESMYRMLRESNLIENVDSEAGIKLANNGDEELEDREMRRLERNLGIKSNKKLATAFFDEGLGELFNGMEFGSKNVRSANTEDKPKATAAQQAAKNSAPATAAAVDDDDDDDDSKEESGASDNDLVYVEYFCGGDDDDVAEDDGEDMFGLDAFGLGDQSDGSESDDSDIAEMYRSQGIDINPELEVDLKDEMSEDSMSEEEEEEEEGEQDDDDDDEIEDDGSMSVSEDEDRPKKQASSAPTTSTSAVAAAVSKYIPPSLRRKQAEGEAEDERVVAIRKALQGQLNRLSESNIDGIIMQIEAQYQKYPRHYVTDVLSNLILQSIRSRIHMLDSFLYVNAALVGAVYRAVGLEPVAHMVQKLMEDFEKHFKQGLAEFNSSKDTEGAEELSSGKECQNLCVFIAELYNFQVISCQLVYDVIRLCVEDINEFTAELLLKLIRICGMQLRRDDPLALKEIVQQVTETVGKAGSDKGFSVRCRFMVENLTHLKDNRMRNTMSQNAENVARLKKFLGNMDKQRSVASAEPINIRLQDIRDVETKGKWWLVGASWVGNQHNGEQQNDSLAAREALRKMKEQTGDSEMDRLLRMAREQHMNTDVRRSIFITLLSSDDYNDAFQRLLKLDLKKAQVREVVRVVLHCCGQEAAYNPYYTLVALKLCFYHKSYMLTMQYALWDFLRELGESDVGGLGRIGQEDDSEVANVPLRRVVNVAKLYAWLIDKQALSLTIFKTVTFAKVGVQARVFFQVLFSTMFLQHKGQAEKDEQKLQEVFEKATANPAMCHGILFFFHHFVRSCELVPEEERPLMKWGCRVAKLVFRNAASSDMQDDF
ncbi:suppressor of glycerol defect [Coemansia sp. Benny D115]|nr:suppressor of glycerol defect [Coemansia sp. Benny D115]